MLKRLPARFYRTDSGREPVREWLLGLDAGDRRVIGEYIKDVEFSWPIGMPLVRALGHGVCEVRSSLAGGPCVILHRTELHGALAWLYQEDTKDTPKRD